MGVGLLLVHALHRGHHNAKEGLLLVGTVSQFYTGRLLLIAQVVQPPELTFHDVHLGCLSAVPEFCAEG